MDKENKRAEKARALRYKKAMLAELNIEYITDRLSEISEDCDNVRYHIDSNDGTLLNALDGDEDEEFEFKIMFCDLSAECEELYDILYDTPIPERFDDVFVGIMMNGRSAFTMVGYDGLEEDYFSLTNYEEKLTENEACKRLKRLTKDELIKTFGQCFGIAMSFLNVQQKYQELQAAFDIIRSENTSYLQIIRDIDKAHEAAETDGWSKWSDSYRRFESLTKALPDKAWIE
ncbi:MAG: hypothetical protein J1G06_08630 [Oscillospiraceae bacterium]|nr:hypothetical protein [Oscillospiraceae bacterium]